MFPRTKITLYISTILLSACANISNAPSVSATGIDGEKCVGMTPATVEGLSPNNDSTLLKKAQYETGKGGVCTAKSFVATAPLNVYRVYDEKKPWSAYGGWWAMTRPSGSKDDYRANNAICKEWSNLDRLISCQVKIGAEIVLGTTQSVTCEDGSTYPKTAAVQVYIPNDQKNSVLYVENCREEGRWP